jgi:peroxiredoxin
LSVPSMDCPVCPITVKKALTLATKNAGYPSTLVTITK